MSITTQTMVVNLQISLWTGHRLDKDASARVTADANAEQDAARVNKHLVPKEALKPITQAATAMRLHFYEKTLPWKDNGDRLLPRKLYTDFLQVHAQHVDQFNQAVDTFLTTAYPSAREQAAFRMGALFKDTDYPSADQLRRKFGVTLDIDAVSEAQDFRVALDQAHTEQIKAGIEQRLQERIGRAMYDVWQRLADTVGHFAEKMADQNAIFRDSTVKNLYEILEILPGLNVLNDPHIDHIAEQIRASLLGPDAATIRKQPAVRAQLAADAQVIMDQMSSFMAAFEEAA